MRARREGEVGPEEVFCGEEDPEIDNDQEGACMRFRGAFLLRIRFVKG